MRGPQAWIASAIRDALGEFFVVGLDQIESSLTKVVLKDVRLKPQFESIPINTFGKNTHIEITGFVREVSLNWSWELSSSNNNNCYEHDRHSRCWIKDAILNLKGCRFKVRLTQEEILKDYNNKDVDVGTSNDNKNTDRTTSNCNSNSNCNNDEQEKESKPETDSKNDDDDDMTIQEKIQHFLEEQIEMVVNSLALIVEDFEIIVEMPSPKILSTIPGVNVFSQDEDEAGGIEITVELSERDHFGISVYEDPESDGNIEIVESFGTKNTNDTQKMIDKEDYKISLKVAGEELNVLSYGKYSNETLKERISLSSVFCNVTETFGQKQNKVVCKTYPMVESFSYALGFTRNHGERFSDIGRGLVVKGGLLDETTTTLTNGLVIQLDRPQLEAIGQLIGLIMPPEEEAAKQKEEFKTDDYETQGDVSVFEISFDSVDMELMGGDELSAKALNLTILADGSDLFIEVETARFEEAVSDTKRLGILIEASDIIASALPTIDVTLGYVDRLYIPDVVELRTPIENVRVQLIGATWTVDIDLLDGYLPSPEVESQNNEKQEAIPFAIACKVKQIFLVKDEDEDDTEVALKNVEILAYPKTKELTELACTIQSLESKLASATNINTCMVLPETEDHTNTVRKFALSVDNLSVTAGYTIQDWKKTFRIGGKWRRNTISDNNKLDDGSDLKLPFCHVAPVKTRIAYSALRVVSVRETTFLVKAYKGHRNTTAKDLLDFYTAECLSQTPEFLQNAELLGINVKSAGAFSLGAHFIPSPIGPFVGVAAVVGVDAVRGSIEAGKRSRKAQEGEAARAGDFFRGIGYSAVEATRRGKLRRSGSLARKGNLLDWMVGATENTGEYIGKNKDTLGSAGGAGAGVLVGTLIAGPVGAVIGGVVGGMTTGTAIRRIDRRIKTILQKQEDTKLKPGQLALSPS